MPFVPAPGCLAVDVVYLFDNQRVENTLYFERGDGWDTTSISNWLTTLRQLIVEELMPLLSETIALIELAGRLLDTATAIGVVNTVSPPETGGVPGNAAPNNVTYTISFRTGLTGRSFRGRNYVPGIPNGDAVGNTISTAFRTGVLAFYTELLAQANADEITWVVLSRFSGVDPVTGDPIPRTTGVTTPILTVGTFDSTVDSQRRRLPGRGN